MLPVLQSREEIRGSYDGISGVDDLLSKRSEEPLRREALATLGPRRGERVLEIGFGTGHCLARAVGPSGDVYGFDLSDEMLRIARKNLRTSRLASRVELRRGDGAMLPYPADLLDAVFMSFTLELFDTRKIRRVLAECKRVLRPGGRIAVAGLSKEGGRTLAVKAFEWTHRHFPHLLDCRLIFVRRALEGAGFRIKMAHRRTVRVPVETVLAVKPGA